MKQHRSITFMAGATMCAILFCMALAATCAPMVPTTDRHAVDDLRGAAKFQAKGVADD